MTMGNPFYDFLLILFGLLFGEWTTPVQVQNIAFGIFDRGVTHSRLFDKAYRKTLPLRLAVIVFLAVVYAIVNVVSTTPSVQGAVFVLVFVAYMPLMIAHMLMAEKYAKQAVKDAAKDEVDIETKSQGRGGLGSA